MAETNYGISGVGSLTAHNVAVGAGASIVEQAMPAAVREELAKLRTALAVYEGDPDARARMLNATEDVAAELDSPAPSRPKLLERLTQIKEAAGSTGAVATAVTAMISLISLL